MPKKEIKSPLLYEPPGGGAFSSAIEAPAGRTIYVSGLTSRNKNGEVVGEGDITAQTEQVMQNLKAALEAGGATFEDIVKVTVFIRDMEDFAKIHAVRKRYFTKPFPASSMVEVSRLVDQRLLIEIEAIAVVG
ncbi:MAG TPA: RidA family protein [Candidatus Dormibacteraeota bacterium]|nr:RidA family protein [Candidatus Dormibacteraeota bacterium]